MEKITFLVETETDTKNKVHNKIEHGSLNKFQHKEHLYIM